MTSRASRVLDIGVTRKFGPDLAPEATARLGLALRSVVWLDGGRRTIGTG